MTAWTLYLMTRCEPLHQTLTIAQGLLTAMLVLLAIAGGTSLVTVGRVLIPSREDLAIILVGEWVTNSEQMRALPDNVARVANKILKDFAEK